MEKILNRYESETISRNYSKYRQTYPRQVLDKLFTFAEKHNLDTTMALDLACGTGHSTFELCSRYRRTVGVDISKAQLERAREKAAIMEMSGDVEFVQAPAGQLPLQDASVDLVTCATAWHWLDPIAVFPEIDRVLKSKGALVVYSYTIPILRHDECSRIFHDFCSTKCSWPDGPHGNVLEVSQEYYETVSLPFPLTERFDMLEEMEISLEAFRGFVTSFDSHEAYCRDHPEDSNALDDMIQEMKRVLLDGSIDEYFNPQLSKVTMTIAMPYFMLFAVKT